MRHDNTPIILPPSLGARPRWLAACSAWLPAPDRQFVTDLVQMDSPSPRQLHRLGLLAARLERPSEEDAL